MRGTMRRAKAAGSESGGSGGRPAPAPQPPSQPTRPRTLARPCALHLPCCRRGEVLVQLSWQRRRAARRHARVVRVVRPRLRAAGHDGRPVLAFRGAPRADKRCDGRLASRRGARRRGAEEHEMHGARPATRASRRAREQCCRHVGASTRLAAPCNARKRPGLWARCAPCAARRRPFARGAADGLVAPDGVSKMLDWRPDGQRYCALYLGIDEPGIVCPQPGGAEFGYVPSTMALWVRSGTPS